MSLVMEWMKGKSLSVSIENRIIVGIVDQRLNSTNHMPEVEGSRNR